jgi:CubicO group peptidase (beta-lactamase class C family)
MKNLLITLFISFSFFLLENNNVYSQNMDTNNLKVWIDAQFAEGMDSFNIPGATFILMQGDSILHMNGYGIADIETNTPVNNEFSIFGIASISKTFVGTAIMQLFEEGKVQLDQDINKYLKSFQIEYKFGEPISLKHLLTHTAGFDERNIGTAVRTEKNVISLAQYLKKRMPPQIRPAGEALTYSNHGYALLGLIVEEVSGLPFDEYVRKRILKPLGMNSSGFMRQSELRKNYVTSYLQKDSLLIPYKLDFPLYYPAGSFSSTASDMAHYISMYLNNGSFHGAQILDSTTVVQMHKTAFKHYEEAENGWLLGFYEYRWNGLKIITHGGDIQGFASELMLIPEKNIGLFLCVNASSITDSKSRIFISSFINKLWSRLMPDVLVEKENSKIIQEIGSVAEPLATFSGTYRYTRYAQTTLDKLAVLIGFAPEVEILTKGDTLEIVEWNDKLIPVSDLTFYSTTYKPYRGFGRNNKGEIAYFFPGGTSSYHKLNWYEPVKFQIYWVGSIVLILLISIIVSVMRKLFVRNKKSHSIKKIIFPIALLIILFLAFLVYVLIKTDPQEFSYGIPLLIKIILVLPFLFIPLELFSVWLLIKVWRAKELGTFDLIYQSIIVVAALAFIPWLMYWNLIGFNY